MGEKGRFDLGLNMIGIAALFLAGFFLLVIFGAQSYRGTVAGRSGNMDDRALLAYLAKPEDERKDWELSMDFPVFLKSSYLRETALGSMERFPVNVGVAVKGLEYQ